MEYFQGAPSYYCQYTEDLLLKHKLWRTPSKLRSSCLRCFIPATCFGIYHKGITGQNTKKYTEVCNIWIFMRYIQYLET